MDTTNDICSRSMNAASTLLANFANSAWGVRHPKAVIDLYTYHADIASDIAQAFGVYGNQFTQWLSERKGFM
jgi:hypothetical protein